MRIGLHHYVISSAIRSFDCFSSSWGLVAAGRPQIILLCLAIECEGWYVWMVDPYCFTSLHKAQFLHAKVSIGSSGAAHCQMQPFEMHAHAALAPLNCLALPVT